MCGASFGFLSNCDQQFFHYEDLVALICVDVGGESEDIGVLPGMRAREQFLDHLKRALMVPDHEFQEQPVEFAPTRGIQLCELIRVEHAGHHRVRMRGTGNRLPAFHEPLLHHRDLITLGYVDLARELEQFRGRAMRRRHLRHADRLGVMADHVLHEAHVRNREARSR